jgi:uncharacterized protein
VQSGFADLPLHGGRVPPWLSERMTKLGSAIAENIFITTVAGNQSKNLANDYTVRFFSARLSPPLEADDS